MTRTTILIATATLGLTVAIAFAQAPTTPDTATPDATQTQARAMAQRQVQDPTLGHDPAADPIRAMAQAMQRLHQQDAAQAATSQRPEWAGQGEGRGAGAMQHQADPAAMHAQGAQQRQHEPGTGLTDPSVTPQRQGMNGAQRGAHAAGSDGAQQGQHTHQQLHEPGTGVRDGAHTPNTARAGQARGHGGNGPRH